MHFATRRSRRVNRYNGWRLEDAWLDKSTLTARSENGARRRTEGKGTVDDTTSSQSHGCRRNAARALRPPAALAQKSRGVLRQYIIDSPASMSIHEETTVVAERPMMAVMSNLVLFDQHVPQNSLSDILPDLATDWAWDEDGTRLTLHLRQGVKWHDGKPFTAADVKCTWDLVQGKGPERLRVNPRKAWYNNLSEVVPNGDYEVTFELKRQQLAFIALLATGMSPVYPCHVCGRL